MDKGSEVVLKKVMKALEELQKTLADRQVAGAGSEAGQVGDSEDAVKAAIKSWFSEREQTRRAAATKTGEHLKNSFDFLAKIYGEEQEMVLFLTRLDAGHFSLNFIQNEGSEEYYNYNKLLLLRDRRAELKSQILEADI